MATPPTRVLDVTPDVGWTSNASPKTTPTFDVQAGDLLVYMAFSEDSTVQVGAPTWTGSGAWVLQQSVVVNNYCTAYLYTCEVTATATGRTVSAARTSGASTYSFIVSVWRNHGGVGVSGKANVASGAPSLVLNAAANSALVMGNSDWNASSPTGRVWRTVNGSPIVESSFGGSAGVSYMCYTGYSLDAGAAGNETVGLTAPTGQKYSIVGVEILGVEGGSTPNTGTVTGGFTVAGSATGARTPKGVSTGAVTITGLANGKRTPKGGTVTAFTFDTAADGVRHPVGAVASAWGITGSASGKRQPLGAGTSSWAYVGAAVGTAPTTANDGSAVSVWQVATSAVSVRASRGVTTAGWDVGSNVAGARNPIGTVTAQWSILAVATGGSDLRNITVTATLPERAWSSSLTARAKTGTLQPNRWAGTL